MPRGGHARVGPVMLDAAERKLRGSRTRPKHRAAEHSQLMVEQIERELAAAQTAPPAAGGPETKNDDRQDGPAIPGGVEPPDGLSELELKFWKHYAPGLRAQRRLTILARDTLAGYCSALAIIAELRTEMADKSLTRKDRAAARKELRQYLGIKRLYESDLLINPATAARVPSFDDPLPLASSAEAANEFDDEFDDAAADPH